MITIIGLIQIIINTEAGSLKHESIINMVIKKLWISLKSNNENNCKINILTTLLIDSLENIAIDLTKKAAKC